MKPPKNKKNPAVHERITVNLIEKASEDLSKTATRSGMTRTDVLNRALQMYGYLDAESRKGKEVLIRDKKTGEVWKVVFH